MDNIKNDSYYIQKILSDLEFMIEHTKGLSKEEIQADDVLLDSIMFRIIQVAENSDRLSEKFKDIHDDLPWKDIKGMRNRIVHDYGVVDISIVCDTVLVSVPELYSELKLLI